MKRFVLCTLAIACGLALAAAGIHFAPWRTAHAQPAGAVERSTIGDPASTPPPASPSPPPPLSSLLPGALGADDGAVGLVVYDRKTARVIARHDSAQSFPVESVIKLLIGLDALDRGDDPDLIARMLSRSDDAIATRLWNEDGRHDVVTRMAARLGLRDTVPDSLPYMWGQTMTTADDILAVYRYILDTAPAAHRDLILGALRAATHYGADGFDQYFGIPDAAGDLHWAVKQGWACCRPNRVLHTTGLVGGGERYVLIVLTSHPPQTTWQADKDQLTTLVRRLLPALA